MTDTLAEALSGRDMKSNAAALIRRKRTLALAVPVVILAYLVYIFVAFDIPGLAQRASLENGQTLVRDAYSHKVHVTRDNDDATVSVSVEGERKGRYPEGQAPDWVALGETTEIDLGGGHVVTFGPERVIYDVPGYGRIATTPNDDGVNADLPDGPVPEWINLSKNRLTATTEAGRLTVTRNRSEVFRYFGGWELFFFTLDSPYHGQDAGALMQAAMRGEAGAVVSDVWNNSMWRHKDVAWAIFETILMAFLGTMGAALVALPLGFLAAKNFAPLSGVRFAFRRFFDFVRGVDALIWTIVLSRAFGPGPLTGTLAILITDTGSFGKLFSEALENVDDKQIEGVRSTGARPVQRYRFGVIPQVTPVLLSQILYFFESNTRSATIIGAITGGGIGLMLTQAIITQKDWEEVTYYIVLIVLMVIFMDWVSGILRRRLIKGGGKT